jgi:hypothetical protein
LARKCGVAAKRVKQIELCHPVIDLVSDLERFCEQWL